MGASNVASTYVNHLQVDEALVMQWGAGVKQSLDGADVATTLSLVEWFLNFYGQSQEGPVCPLECTVEAGELLFVPHGWWHMAMNLEVSTQMCSCNEGAGAQGKFQHATCSLHNRRPLQSRKTMWVLQIFTLSWTGWRVEIRA